MPLHFSVPPNGVWVWQVIRVERDERLGQLLEKEFDEVRNNVRLEAKQAGGIDGLPCVVGHRCDRAYVVRVKITSEVGVGNKGR